jgi:hypothetical protein
MKQGKPKISTIKCSKKTQKCFKKLGNEEYRDQRTHLYGRIRALLEVIVRRKAQLNERTEWIRR